MKDEQLEDKFKASMMKTLDHILIECKERGYISLINIFYWSQENARYEIIELDPKGNSYKCQPK